MNETCLIGASAASTTDETILTNAQLVLPTETLHGTIVFGSDGISDVQPGLSRSPAAIDCEGDFVSPGLIELHTDNLERHMQPRPGVKWPSAHAIIAHDAELASVGITTVFDALRIGSILSSQSKYGKYARTMASEIISLRAAGALRISHMIHLRAEICSETLEEELAEFGADDRIGILSLMDHTPGQRQFADEAQHRFYLKGKYGMSDAVIDAHFEKLHAIRDKFGDRHWACALSKARELGAVLASHDDTTVEHAAHSNDLGVQLAEFPTSKPAALALNDAGVAVMMGAPNLLRGGSHSGNVAASELEAEDCLDILSSDYAPSSLLAAAVRLGVDADDMAKGIATVTSAPAKAASLPDRGSLAQGLRADILRFTLHGDVPISKGVWVKGVRAG
ncbi:MAG: alpha-D-ribose 1-methylphosphonate 5-triphosphate diphosphatase [Pseudomonadota bacterium]